MGAAATTVSTHRKTDPAKLGKLLRRDLDWIVMKALQKDRTRRYQTANDFARDIQRYLADEPTEARPPTLAGRMAKWGRRHRSLVRSAAVVLGAVIAVLAVSAFLLLEAYEGERREHRAAVANAAEAEDNAAKARDNAAKAQENAAKAEKNYAMALNAVKQMLTRVADEKVARIPEMKEVRRRLLEDAVAFYTELLKNNPRDSLAHFERGQAYAYKARAAFHIHLENYDKALPDIAEAVKLNPDDISILTWLPLDSVASCPDEGFRQGLIGVIDKTIEKVGDKGGLSEIRAILLATLNRRQEALAAFAKARELNPDLAWREGPIAEIHVHHYGLVAPDDRRLGEAVNYLRERAHANDTLSPPLIRWASQWVPAAMRGTDNLPGIVFVSDLPWVRSTCGSGASEAVRNITPWCRTILIDLLPYAFGIHTWPFEDARPADVVLDVTGQNFSAFKAQVGLRSAKGSVQYQVLVDGSIRCETSVLRAGMLCSIGVDVVGAKEIVLRVLNGGDGNASDSAAWGFARLLRADALDPLEEPPVELRSATETNAAFFLAEVHWRLDHKELARRWYDRGVEWMDKKAPKDEQLLRFRAEADEEQAISALVADPQAIMTLAKLAAESPDQPDLRRRLAGVVIRRIDGALGANRFDEAITMLQTLPKDFPAAADYRCGVAKCLSQNGQYDGAIASLEKLTADFPAVAEYRKELARAYFHRGDKPFHQDDLEKAFPDLDRVVQYDPNYSEAYDHRGFVYLSRGELDKAIADYDQAIRFGPAYQSSYPNRAAAYLGKGEFDKAIGDLAKAIDLAPNAANAWYLRACVRLAAARVEEYRKDCGGMLQRFAETDNPTNAHWTAWTCVLTPDSVGDWQMPIALAERAAKSDSKAFHHVDTLGSVLYRAGRFEEAIQRLGEADRLAQDATGRLLSSPVYTWYFLAMAHHRLGHREEAKKWLDKAVEATRKALSDHEAGKVSLVWNRRLTLNLFRNEAEALITGVQPNSPLPQTGDGAKAMTSGSSKPSAPAEKPKTVPAVKEP